MICQAAVLIFIFVIWARLWTRDIPTHHKVSATLPAIPGLLIYLGAGEDITLIAMGFGIGVIITIWYYNRDN